MSGEAWLWAVALGMVGFWLGYRAGVDRACKAFAVLLIKFDLWDAYRAASIRDERRDA